jgi:hypothetical protein
MRLCTFALVTPLGPQRRIGLETPQGILDATAARIAFRERRLPAAAAQRVAEAEVPPDMLALLATGPLALEWLPAPAPPPAVWPCCMRPPTSPCWRRYRGRRALPAS